MISKQWQRRQMKKLGHQLPRNWTPPPKKKKKKKTLKPSVIPIITLKGTEHA